MAARGDAVLEVGLDPVLDALREAFAPMDERHPRAVAVEVERRFGRRVLSAHDDDVAAVERDTRRRSATRTCGSSAPGHLEPPRIAEESGGEDRGRRRRIRRGPPRPVASIARPPPGRGVIRSIAVCGDHANAEALGDAAVVRRASRAASGARRATRTGTPAMSRRSRVENQRISSGKWKIESRIPPRS